MNALLVVPDAVYFTGTGSNDGKRLKFTAKTLLSNFNAYVVKVNGTDTQTLTLSANDKNNKFTDDAGVWYLLGLLKIEQKSVTGKTYTYTVGAGDGERVGTEDEAAQIKVVYSTGAPSGTNITNNTIAGSAHVTGSGIPTGYELNINSNAGNNRYAQFSADSIQSKVHIHFIDGNGIWRGIIDPSSSSDVLWVDLRAFSTGFYMIAFVQKDYDPDGNPDPDFPYTFNVGDPVYDGTVKHEDE